MMKQDLQQQLNYLTEQIQAYKETDILDGNQLVEILGQITTTLYFLESERSEFHKIFQDTVNKLVLEKSSVSRAENMAHVKTPELYLLRHIMSSAYEVVNAIRSQISWIKSEKNSI